MRSWSPRRWGIALVGTTAVALLTGLPTVMIENPVFSRMLEREWWNRPVWLLTSVLAGLLLATYVRTDAVGTAPSDADTTPDGVAEGDARRATVGGVLTYFAIGCPVCNKLVLLALGTSGATSVFAPLQPLLALASVALLALALRARLRTADSCPVPTTPVA